MPLQRRARTPLPLSRFAKQTLALSFGSGVLLELAASTSVWWLRERGGGAATGLALDTFFAAVALCVFALTMRPLYRFFVDPKRARWVALRPSAVLVPQLLGVAAGFPVAGFVLSQGFGWPLHAEHATELVNEAVSVMATLIAAWGTVFPTLKWRLLGAMFGVLIFYGLTRTQWNVDSATVAASINIQTFVVSQVLAAATAFVAVRELLTR